VAEVSESSFENVWTRNVESFAVVEGVETVVMGKRLVFEKSFLELQVS